MPVLANLFTARLAYGREAPLMAEEAAMFADDAASIADVAADEAAMPADDVASDAPDMVDGVDIVEVELVVDGVDIVELGGVVVVVVVSSFLPQAAKDTAAARLTIKSAVFMVLLEGVLVRTITGNCGNPSVEEPHHPKTRNALAFPVPNGRL